MPQSDEVRSAATGYRDPHETVAIPDVTLTGWFAPQAQLLAHIGLEACA